MWNFRLWDEGGYLGFRMPVLRIINRNVVVRRRITVESNANRVVRRTNHAKCFDQQNLFFDLLMNRKLNHPRDKYLLGWSNVYYHSTQQSITSSVVPSLALDYLNHVQTFACF